ncbi:MAG: aminotransferase class V-fold PLP-dependent enzyme [Chitinophagaceae bacterium]
MEQDSISMEELARYRKDTAGCQNVAHFNNAGASLPADVVVDTVVQYLKAEAISGGYETEDLHAEKLEQVYALIAELIGGHKDEIAICENASTAWTIAFKGLSLKPGDEIITSELEYVSNLLNLLDAERTGVKVNVIMNDEHGHFPLQALEQAINEQTKLIAVTHIPSSGGNMLPIEEIGSIAQKHQIFYMVDACQSIGQYPVDVKNIKCQVLSATGRKYLRAPRGTGFLYVSKSAQEMVRPLLIDQHATSSISLEGYSLRPDARRYELYEKNRALSLGLGKAVEYVLDVGIGRVWERVRSLAALIREGLSAIPGITVHDHGDQLCGIVTFTSDAMHSRELRDKLVNRGINVSVGGAAATLHYMQRNGLTSLVRASVHYYNTEEEIDRLITAVKEITVELQ